MRRAIFARASSGVGLSASGEQLVARHRPILSLGQQRPTLAADVFIASSANVVGDVLCYDRSSVWYGATVRGDKSKVRIGRVTAVLDRAVLSTVSSPAVDTGFPLDLNIGSYVTVGQGSVLTSCTIGDGTQIQPGVVVQEGSVVEKNCILAAGSVVLQGMLVPQGQFWAGNPAKYVRDVAEEEFGTFEKRAEANAALALEHAEEFLPFGTAYLNVEGIASSK